MSMPNALTRMQATPNGPALSLESSYDLRTYTHPKLVLDSLKIKTVDCASFWLHLKVDAFVNAICDIAKKRAASIDIAT
jgi:hypothetical protein